MKNGDLKSIRSSIKKIERLKKKVHCGKLRLYNNVSKKYKNFDWTKNDYTVEQLKPIIQNNGLFVHRRLLENKILRRNSSTKTYTKRNVENIFLFQQLMCQMDDEFWNPKTKPNTKIQYKPFHFNSLYRGKIYLFSYPKTREWKAELLTQFLKTKQFLFDEDCPHWKGMKKLRYFCEKNLMNASADKWQYQVQRFLRKKD